MKFHQTSSLQSSSKGFINAAVSSNEAPHTTILQNPPNSNPLSPILPFSQDRKKTGITSSSTTCWRSLLSSWNRLVPLLLPRIRHSPDWNQSNPGNSNYASVLASSSPILHSWLALLPPKTSFPARGPPFLLLQFSFSLPLSLPVLFLVVFQVLLFLLLYFSNLRTKGFSNLHAQKGDEIRRQCGRDKLATRQSSQQFRGNKRDFVAVQHTRKCASFALQRYPQKP